MSLLGFALLAHADDQPKLIVQIIVDALRGDLPMRYKIAPTLAAVVRI